MLTFRASAVAGLLSLSGTLLTAAPVYAAPPKTFVTVGFKATVNSVVDLKGLVPGVHVGDFITGTYAYDPATPDTNPDTAVGDYAYAGKTDNKVGATVNLGQFATQTDKKNTNFSVEILDNYGGNDKYSWRSDTNTSTGPAVGLISVELDDPTQTALASAALRRSHRSCPPGRKAGWTWKVPRQDSNASGSGQP
jgi:hypothetical protein